MQRCARCHLGISASEMVMRARDSVYHLSCFTCTSCHKTLSTGDQFGMKESMVYCRLHFESLMHGEYPHQQHPQLNYAELAAKGASLALPYFNGTGTVQKGRPRKRKSPAMGIDISSYNSGKESEGLVLVHYVHYLFIDTATFTSLLCGAEHKPDFYITREIFQFTIAVNSCFGFINNRLRCHLISDHK